jgi:hypothetical protein
VCVSVINDNHMLVTNFFLKRISNWIIVTSIECNETPQFDLMGSIWLKTTRLRTLLVPSVTKELKDTWIASL